MNNLYYALAIGMVLGAGLAMLCIILLVMYDGHRQREAVVRRAVENLGLRFRAQAFGSWLFRGHK